MQFTLAMKEWNTGINLTKYIQDLHDKNYKTLMKEIKEELNKCRDIPYSWVGKLNIVKILAVPTLIYRFNSVPIKILVSYFVDINKLIVKFFWKGKRLRLANTILKEKNKVRRLIEYLNLSLAIKL